MSFTQDFHDQCQHLMPLLAAAEKADKDFHTNWKVGLQEFGAIRYKQTDRYRQTLNRFQQATQAIDKIVSVAFTQAKVGDHTQVPILFAYIALPDRYFRSGYQRASIWRFVKRLPLNEEHSRILRGIVLRQVEAAGPEFVEIMRVVQKIKSAELLESVRNILLRPQKAYILARAKRLLSILEAGSS
jgi:hypothetical protein